MIDFYYLFLFIVNLILLLIIFNLVNQIKKCCQDKKITRKTNKRSNNNSNNNLIICNKENVKSDQKTLTILINKYLLKNLKKGDLITGIQFRLKNRIKTINYKSSNFTIEIYNMKKDKKILVKKGINCTSKHINDFTPTIKFDQGFTYLEEDIIIDIKNIDSELYNIFQVNLTNDGQIVPLIQLEISKDSQKKLIINPALLLRK